MPHADRLTALLPRLADEMRRINLRFEAGHRREAVEQFHALASLVVRTQRDDLDSKGYLLAGRTKAISACRIPARPRPDRPLALFLPGLLASLPLTAARVLPLCDLFDILICELPGHGASDPLAEVSLQAFTDELATLLDTALANAGGLFVIGESLGGLLALGLARRRPDRVRNVVLLDPPFELTRPDLAAWICQSWRNNGCRPYVGRICHEIMGFDPDDGRSLQLTRHHHLATLTSCNCLLIAGGDAVRSGAGSALTSADCAELLVINPRLLLPPRVPDSGHAVLLDNPAGVRAVFDAHIVRRAP